MDKDLFSQALGLIGKYDRIIIHRHKNPDGDALGSQIGLKTIIKDNFPEKEVYCVGDEAGRLSFMEGSAMDEVDSSLFDDALAIVLDTSSPRLISDERYKMAAETLRFDHHLFVEKICSLEVLDTTAESCCGIIVDFAEASGLALSPLSSKSLYTGMVTDSGRFLYDSVSRRSHERAALLLSEVFDRNEIFSNLYAEDFSAIKRKNSFMERIALTENGVAYVYSSKKDVEDMGISAFSVARGLVNTMANIKGVHIWVNFAESDEGVLCELRSNRDNINPVAVKYGGGGHAKASGATVKDREEAFLMLNDLDKMAGENR